MRESDCMSQKHDICSPCEYDVIDSLSDSDLLKSDRYLIEYHLAKTKNIKKMIDRFKFLGYNILNLDDPNFQNDLGFFFAKR